MFLPFPAVCHKSPQRTLSLCRPSRPPAEASFPVCGCKGTRFFLFAKLFHIFFLSFFDICQTRPDFQGVAGKDFFEKSAAAATTQKLGLRKFKFQLLKSLQRQTNSACLACCWADGNTVCILITPIFYSSSNLNFSLSGYKLIILTLSLYKYPLRYFFSSLSES